MSNQDDRFFPKPGKIDAGEERRAEERAHDNGLDTHEPEAFEEFVPRDQTPRAEVRPPMSQSMHSSHNQLVRHVPPEPRQSGSKLEQNDVIALVLAFFLPGIGQVYLGQTYKGLVIFAISVFTCYLGGLLSLASVIDTYLVAMAKKSRMVGEWEFFPDIRRTLEA